MHFIACPCIFITYSECFNLHFLPILHLLGKFPLGAAAALLTVTSSTSSGIGELRWILPLASALHVVFCFHRVEPFLRESAKASGNPSLSCRSGLSLHLLLPSPLCSS